MRNLGNLMVDLETMGNKPGCALTSIGAVEFDINTGETGREFYVSIDLQSSIDAGLKVEGKTIMWWLSQGESARKELIERKKINLSEALWEFRKFLQELGTEELKLWGNSARFDLGGLHSAYQSINREIPWYFRHERCVRTLVAFAPEIKKECVFNGTEHNPIDDCKFQIEYCSKIWRKLNGGK